MPKTLSLQVDAAKPLADGTPGLPTHFSINVSATSNSSAVVAVPASFSGSITGACSLSGSIRDEAVCLVADAKKSRWTVRQDFDIYPNESTFSSPAQYPPHADNGASAKPEEGDSAASNVPEHSLVSYALLEVPGIGDAAGTKQRSRRHVVYDSDYGLGSKRLDAEENAQRATVRKVLLYYLGACIGWTLMIYSLTVYFEGPAEAFWGLTLMPLLVSIVFPMVVIGDTWTMYHYKPPSVGHV